MKKIILLLALLLVIAHFGEAKDQTKELTNDACVFLTVQSENGRIKLQNNDDGSIAIILMLDEVVCVSNIILNGEDVTNQMEKNLLTIPPLHENMTLEVNFEKRPHNVETAYRTIAMN